ncbi:MAG: endolytic transglycosylase MltG [Alphaproteobacteria bacterium]|nr:endolytic transglycosylase MltG [Alphaproteobacteria bacterium]
MRWLRYGALGIIALVVVTAAVLGWGVGDYFAAGPLAKAKVVVVPKGSSVEQIAETLGQAGVIAHPWAFAAAVHVTGTADRLKAGEYEFAAAISPRAIVGLLLSGRVVRHKLTVVEGLTSAEVVALVDAAPALAGSITIPPPEGSVLPQTYFYIYGEQRNELVARMTHAMDAIVAKTWAGRAPGLPLANAQQMVTLASIIERETARADERARVAGVYIDRLRINMPLQADPTVIYGLTDAGRKPLGRALGHDDLLVDTPYNTYKFKGLPPTPICNPGAAALEAAVHPDLRGELYFVADGDGGHRFAKTLAQQDKNIAELRARTQAKTSGAAQ